MPQNSERVEDCQKSRKQNLSALPRRPLLELHLGQGQEQATQYALLHGGFHNSRRHQMGGRGDVGFTDSLSPETIRAPEIIEPGIWDQPSRQRGRSRPHSQHAVGKGCRSFRGLHLERLLHYQPCYRRGETFSTARMVVAWHTTPSSIIRIDRH